MTTFTVRVVDKLTQRPVPKALVFLIPGNPMGGPVRRTTGVTGVVTFYDGPPILNVREFDVIAYAPDYYGAAESVQFSTQSVQVTLELEPTERMRQERHPLRHRQVIEPARPLVDAVSNVRIPPQ